MIDSNFEGLESRRLMSSASVVASVPDAPELVSDGHVPHVPHVVVPIRHAVSAPGANLGKLVGKYNEDTTSRFFMSRVTITSVDAKGNVKGKLSIPWIISGAKVTGKVTADGKFYLKFAGGPADDRVTGFFNGKMSANGKSLKGWMDYDWGDQPNTGSSPFQQTFLRWGK